MKENRKGSALLWSVILMFILSVIIAAALTISFSYYNKAVRTNEKRQAYQTAKGVIQNIVQKITSNDLSYLQMIDGLKVGSQRMLSVNFPAVNTVGKIEDGYFEMKEERGEDKKDYPVLTIAIVGEYHGQKEMIKADMKQGELDGTNTWQLLKYYREDYDLKESINITNAKRMFNEMNGYITAIGDLTNYDQQNAALKAYMQLLDPEGYKRVDEMSKAASSQPYKPRKDNSTIRYFMYNRYNPSAWQYIFDFDAAKNQELVKKISTPAYAGAKPELDITQPFYIQPYFCPNDYASMIVYASTSPTSWYDVKLIYDSTSGHWYYLKGLVNQYYINGKLTDNSYSTGDVTDSTLIGTEKDRLTITMFESTNKKMTTGQIWNRFRDYYITGEKTAPGVTPAVRID